MFRKKGSKTDLQTEYCCSIRFLDDSEPIQLSFKKDTIGQWLLDRVCEKLNLVEKDYFGLRYVDSEKQRHWLDPLKTAYKQLKGVNPMVLCFRVKFYPAEPMKLHEEITRYYMFQQLRRDLHHGRLLCSPTDAVNLAAFIIQSEVGDYDPEDHPPGYVAEFKMLPKQNQKIEEQIMEIHKTLQGQVPADAEANFLRKASTLDTYGVDPHQVKDQRGDSLYLGVTHQGIMTFRGSRRTQLFKWNQIKRIAYEGKMFIVHVNVSEDEEANPKKKQQPYGYKCQTATACKYLWRCAVEQQLFFTLSSSINAPKLHSGGTIFTRGSRYRFSGRCQAEAYAASENIRRSEPNFTRSSSLPNFARRTSEGKRDALRLSETLKEDRRRYNVYPRGGRTKVDVPSPSRMISPPELVVQSPTVKAPLAAEEKFEERKQQMTAAAAPPKLNGSIPVAVAVEDGSSTLPYNPEHSYEDDDDDKGSRPSLDEQIRQLEEEIVKSTVEQNHVGPSPGAKNMASPEETKTSASDQKKSGGCCKMLLITYFFLVLVLAILFYVIFFSPLNHPILTEARKQLYFLEPARDFVSDKAQMVRNYFK